VMVPMRFPALFFSVFSGLSHQKMFQTPFLSVQSPLLDNLYYQSHVLNMTSLPVDMTAFLAL